MKQTRTFERWPSGAGWHIGILAMPPQELSERFGVIFQDQFDELGPLVEAVFQNVTIGHFVLSHHPQSPYPGTDVEVDINVGRDEALGAIWAELGLDIRYFSWITSYRRWAAGNPGDKPSPELIGNVGVLTSRESDVLLRSLRGLSPADVADELQISVLTVRAHLSRARLKLESWAGGSSGRGDRQGI